MKKISILFHTETKHNTEAPFVGNRLAKFEKVHHPISTSNISTNIHNQVSYKNCFEHEMLSLKKFNRSVEKRIQDPVKYLKVSFLQK